MIAGDWYIIVSQKSVLKSASMQREPRTGPLKFGTRAFFASLSSTGSDSQVQQLGAQAGGLGVARDGLLDPCTLTGLITRLPSWTKRLVA